MSDALPEGWAHGRLGHLAPLHYGKSLPEGKRVSGRVAVYGSNGVVGYHDSALLEGPAIIVGRKGSVGAIHHCKGPCWPIDTTYFVNDFGPFDPAFLAHALGWLDLSRLESSTAIPGLNRDDAEAQDLPLPPMDEQRRIVAKVEELIAQVHTVRERLTRTKATLKSFRQSVLAAACSGRLTSDWRADNPVPALVHDRAEHHATVRTRPTRRGVPQHVELPESVDRIDVPGSWEKPSIAEALRRGIMLDVKDGNHGSNHPRKGEFGSKGLPFITAAQVNDLTIDYMDAPRVSGAALDRLRVGFAHPGDAILTHKGSVGRAALNTQECVLSPQTTYYRCAEGAIDATYLVLYFNSLHFFGQLASVMSQTTRDFVPISEQYRLFLLLPPLPEQEEIVRRTGDLFSLAASIEKRAAAAAAHVERLPHAVLTRAFAGELVPNEAELARAQGRDYERASALLERTAGERPMQATTRKNGRRPPSAVQPAKALRRVRRKR